MSAKKLAVAVIAVFAMSFSLFGCFGGGESDSSSSSSGQDEIMEAFTGTWDLVEITKDEKAVADDQLAKLEDSTENVFVNLNEDKTAEFQLVTVVRKGVWEASDPTKGVVMLMGDTADMEIADDKLRFEQSGYKMTFSKSSKAREVTDYTRSEKVEDMVIADDDQAKIELTEKRVDEDADPGYVFEVTNKSDKAVYFTPHPESFTVDGVSLEPYGAYSIQPGETFEAFVWFDHHELGSSDLESLKDVVGTIDLWDNETYDVLSSYGVEL